jgi:hypothetical protein
MMQRSNSNQFKLNQALVSAAVLTRFRTAKRLAAAMLAAGILLTWTSARAYVAIVAAPSTSALMASPTTAYPNGVWRTGYYANGDAEQAFYRPLTGPCAANHLVDDGGSCINTTAGDGNSWMGVFSGSSFNVREFGARGNQANDDSSAIQNTINYAQSLGGGEVLFPPGNYCVKSSGLSVTVRNVRLVGVSSGVEIQTCGADVTPITIDARRDSVEHMTVVGSGITGTNNTIVEGSDCVECRLDDLFIAYGQAGIFDQSGEGTVNNVFVTQAYGAALLVAQGVSLRNSAGGPYVTRGKFDQDWPVSTPAYGTIFKAWASGNSYAVGTVVSLDRYYIQCSKAGASGGSPPALANYNTIINDGSAQWKLVGPTTYRSVLINSNDFVYWEINSDHTGSFTYGIDIENGLGGGTGPQSITIVDSACGAVTNQCIYAHDGGNLMVRGGIYSNCIFTNCAGISTDKNWKGDTTIQGATLFGLGYGIQDGAGTGFVAQGNTIAGAKIAAFYAAGDVSGFNFSNNILNSASWGSNPIGAQVATGSSDYYTITNNYCGGAGTCISDGGAGTHKTVSGNY